MTQPTDDQTITSLLMAPATIQDAPYLLSNWVSEVYFLKSSKFEQSPKAKLFVFA